MPALYLVFLSLAGILAAAPQAAAQEAFEAPPEQLAQAAEQRESAPDGERRAVPRGSRPQGDNPQTGTAVPRAERPQASRPAPLPTVRGRVPDRRSTVVVRPPVIRYDRYAYPYYYYPRRYDPYGPWGIGSGYYYGPFSNGYYTGHGHFETYTSYGQLYDVGELRLQVAPRDAQVFVDGYYAGTVDDYDGTFQALKLESGSYAIRIEAPGYETLEFDVRITPRQKITYRGDLRRE